MAIEILRRRPPGEHIVTDTAINLIRGFEGLHLSAYPDPASPLARTGKGSGDPWTIGWGHTRDVKRGDKCTLDEANAWLREDADRAAGIVRTAVQVPLTAGEFAALVSLAYNLGYLPPSLKACLNGGVTDKGVTMEPGSYGAALLQFPRNCRAQTRPMKGLYRRRLAEAAVFSDLPWEDACSPTVIQFELDANGEIDTDATTSLEDTLMRARSSRAPDPASILKKPWSELVADAKPVEPPPVPPPAPPPAPPSGPVVAGPAVVVPAPQPPPPPVALAPPPVIKPPPPPPPVADQQKAVTAANYGSDAAWSSAKSMLLSRRFWGLFLIISGRLALTWTGSTALLNGAADPVVAELMAGFIVMCLGEALNKWGEVKARRPLK